MKRTIAIAASLALAGCAGANYRPLIDSAGRDMNRYEADLADCQKYAAQVSGAADNAAAGAVAGAVLGILLAAAGGRGYSQAATGRVAAVSGGVAGAAQGETDQRNVVRRCIAGRGYVVLN